jgi:ZIP family zinc transporter
LSVYVPAGLWGLLSSGALVLGAALAWFADLPRRLIAAITAFGAGVLVSALSFDLTDEAQRRGGFLPTAAGFLAAFMLTKWGG